MFSRRRARLLLVVLAIVVTGGCTGDPGLCAQLGQLGFCNS